MIQKYKKSPTEKLESYIETLKIFLISAAVLDLLYLYSSGSFSVYKIPTLSFIFSIFEIIYFFSIPKLLKIVIDKNILRLIVLIAISTILISKYMYLSDAWPFDTYYLRGILMVSPIYLISIFYGIIVLIYSKYYQTDMDLQLLNQIDSPLDLKNQNLSSTLQQNTSDLISKDKEIVFMKSLQKFYYYKKVFIVAILINANVNFIATNVLLDLHFNAGHNARPSDLFGYIPSFIPLFILISLMLIVLLVKNKIILRIVIILSLLLSFYTVASTFYLSAPLFIATFFYGIRFSSNMKNL